MHFLDLTLPTPEENLALDEALLLTAEADGRAEYLRVWESPQFFVVLGKNCRVTDDVQVENCHADDVPILRRVSGGGTVLLGPGCLNYALVLRFGPSRQHRGVAESFDDLLDRLLAAVRKFEPIATRAGQSDLVIGNLKFSGNSQRRQRSHLLHHGTLLHHFDLARVARYLKQPCRQPVYRGSREHQAFMTNLAADPQLLSVQLRSVYDAFQAAGEWPRSTVAQLVREKYMLPEWNELGRLSHAQGPIPAIP